jgi:hypothetical protein
MIIISIITIIIIIITVQYVGLLWFLPGPKSKIQQAQKRLAHCRYCTPCHEHDSRSDKVLGVSKRA